MKQRYANGMCGKNAACGQPCTLSPRPHRWCICKWDGCPVCHAKKDWPRWFLARFDDPARESARFDAATWILALGGLAGVLGAGWWM